MKNKVLVLLGSLFVLFVGLKVGAVTPPALEILRVYDEQQTTVNVGFKVTSLGTPASSSRLKIYYGTTPHPTSNYATHQQALSATVYEYKLSSLSCGTKYYFYGMIDSTYTPDGTFTTALCDNDVKLVMAAAGVMSSDSVSATIGATPYSVTPITDYGICYKIDGASSYTCKSGGSGAVSGTLAKMTITNLLPGSLYDFYMYGVNTAGRTNGYENYFRTTGTAPSSSTGSSYVDSSGSSVNSNYSTPRVAIYWDAAEITATSASNWSYLTSDGVPLVVAGDRGICYGTTPSPSFCVASGTPKTSSGDPFYTKITGLTPNTLYYYRAYAKNAAGTVYSTDRTFRTLNGSLPTSPNLKSSAVENVSSSYVAGSPAYFSGTVNNSGTDISKTFYNHFEIKNGSGGSITNLSPVSINSLSSGSSSKVSSSIVLSATGNFSVRLCADQSSYTNNSGVITESDETDNCGGFSYFTVKEASSLNVGSGASADISSGQTGVSMEQALEDTSLYVSNVPRVTSSNASVRVISPNGGETFIQNVDNTITWSGGKNKVQVGLVSEDQVPGTSSFSPAWIDLNGQPNGSIKWNASYLKNLDGTIDRFVTPGKYKIVAISENDYGGYCVGSSVSSSCNYDLSDGLINISSSRRVTTSTGDSGNQNSNTTNLGRRISSTLKYGSRGEQVKILQEYLGIKADGIFGKGTAATVKAWQTKNNLKSDGVFGAMSRATAGL